MTRQEYRKYTRKARRRESISFIHRTIITFTVITVLVMGMALGCSMTAAAGESSGDYKYYHQVQVQDGDSLDSIAAEYMNVTHYADRSELVREIIVTNQLVSETLTSDMILMVPYYDAAVQ